MLALVAAATLFGLLAGEMAAKGRAYDAFALVVVLLPVAIWKRPQLGPAVLLGAAVLVEQVAAAWNPKAEFVPGVGDILPAPPLPITSHIPLFAGLGSLHLEPADLLLLTVALVVLLRTKPGARNWPRTHVSASMIAVLACVVLGIFVGEGHHGQLREALMESRPYVYLASTFFLTAMLIRTRSAIRIVLWTFVIASAIKAVQGVYEWFLVHNWHPRPQSVLGHEDAYTFGIYLLLVIALWLFATPMGRLRKTATWLVPLIMAANLFNDRRAAWLLLGGGMLVLAAVAYRCVPERRTKLKRAGILLLALSVVYIPAYWNKNGTLAQPARAIRSGISPNVRDAASDLYREQEDANLKYNIRQGGILGKGFGVQIDYALPIVNISATDPQIKYIPHNGVLYIPMRMGLLGTIAFWALLGTAIISGCRLAKSKDRETAVIGALVAATVVAYALEGSVDQGFFFYRIAFETGTLLGLAEAARRIARSGQRSAAALEASRSTAPSASKLAGKAPCVTR